ncbi:MAG: nuclear transport factor 2 family protein [Nocardioidaceae bacterium]
MTAAPTPGAQGGAPLWPRPSSDAAEEASTAEAVARFGEAFDRRDVDAVMAAMTQDCVFETTAPPDGDRHVGTGAVRAAWTAFFLESADAVFEAEEQIIRGDRAIVLWRYSWEGGHVRGVDVFRVRDGRVAEKVSYVKG